MPVATRSCAKQNRRPRIEDETPATLCTDRRRYPTRSSVKRKIIHQGNEGKDLEPPSKRAVSSRSSKNVQKTSKKLPFQEISNTLNQDKGGHSKTYASKIPRPHVSHNNDKKAAKSQCNNDVENSIKESDKRSPSLEKSESDLYVIPDANETVPKTPAGCIAARIRSYSALRRSQWKKKDGASGNLDKENTSCSPINTRARSPLGEAMEEEKESDLTSDMESDDDILWKMNRYNGQKEDTMPHAKSDDKSSYKNKYFTLLSAMKQLQNSFLKAQQNAEKNVKAYDSFVSNLKSSLGMEKQKNSLLSEELRIKKGSVERLRTELENTKEQLEYVREEKVNIEKHEQEKDEKEKEKDPANETSETNNKEILQLIEDQKTLINFYSQLTGVSMTRENTSEDTSSFQSFNCTFFPAANTAHCLQFRLTHDKEFDEIEYSPNPQSPGSENILLNLPNYLQDNIFFGAEQAQKFLAKLLKTADGKNIV